MVILKLNFGEKGIRGLIFIFQIVRFTYKSKADMKLNEQIYLVK
jgi:hypothetical protein